MTSWFLVLLHFGLAAFLVLSTNWRPFPWLPVLLAVPGAVLAIWAWLRVGLRKIRVHPEATDSTELITGGPYAIVRHPMYTGLLWFTAPLLLEPISVFRVAAWLGLVAVLFAKSAREEDSMSRRFETYHDYRRKVGRLWPRFNVRR
jgi:protein-S-isoprenylcysteine O-methyltransferase Ste14